VAVDHRHLPDGPRPGERQLPAGGHVAEQQVGDGRTALATGVPDVQDGRHVLGGPAQVQRRPFITSSTTGVPGRHDGLQQLELLPGSSSWTARPLSPIMFCHSPTTTTRHVVSGRADGALQLGVSSKPSRVGRRVAAEHVEHRWEDRAARSDAGA
jgi:hypothetical protein